MKDGVKLFGGFAGTEATLYHRGDPAANPTIIDGENTSYHVVENASNTIFDGFTVTRGNANGAAYPANSGGGMLNDGNTNTLISNCIFSNSAGLQGGAIEDRNGQTTLKDCIFTGNTASADGGAIDIYNNTSDIINCLFYNNSANAGGAVWDGLATTTSIINCTFYNNTGPFGGGLYADGVGPTITNCIFFRHFYDGWSPDELIWDGSGSASEITYSLFYEHATVPPGIGNIATDVVPIERHPYWYLKQGGQAVDAGSDTAANIGLDGYTTDYYFGLPDSGIVDMGYHYPIP